MLEQKDQFAEDKQNHQAQNAPSKRIPFSFGFIAAALVIIFIAFFLYQEKWEGKTKAEAAKDPYLSHASSENINFASFDFDKKEPEAKKYASLEFPTALQTDPLTEEPMPPPPMIVYRAQSQRNKIPSRETQTQSLSGPGRMNGKLKAAAIDTIIATTIKNPSLTITAGTSIPCILETAIDSTLPGFVRCRTMSDAYSTDGKVILLEKGSKVVGEYKGGLMMGHKRVFVIWLRAETPKNVIISMNSPATDSLGRSGLTGEIDTQFLTRFGGAFLLSMLDFGKMYAESKINKNKKQDLSLNLGGMSSPAEIAINSTIDVPIVLRKNQGEIVHIFVARDLDFSSVYNLEPVQ